MVEIMNLPIKIYAYKDINLIVALINTNEILYHVEAITNLFIAEGDYENKNNRK